MGNELEQYSGFGVFVPNPQEMYQTLIRNLLVHGKYKDIAEFMEDQNRQDVSFLISKTNLNSDLLENEETEVEIWVEEEQQHRQLLSIVKSTLTLTDQKHPYGYYSLTRLSRIHQLLVNQGLDSPKTAFGPPYNRYLQVKYGNGIEVSISFGPENPEQETIATQGWTENTVRRIKELTQFGGDLEIILNDQRRALDQLSSIPFTKRSIEVELQDSFREKEVFVDSLQFYARVYKALIKALHQERNLPEPSTPIIFSLPKQLV